MGLIYIYAVQTNTTSGSPVITIDIINPKDVDFNYILFNGAYLPKSGSTKQLAAPGFQSYYWNTSSPGVSIPWTSLVPATYEMLIAQAPY